MSRFLKSSLILFSLVATINASDDYQNFEKAKNSLPEKITIDSMSGIYKVYKNDELNVIFDFRYFYNSDNVSDYPFEVKRNAGYLTIGLNRYECESKKSEYNTIICKEYSKDFAVIKNENENLCIQISNQSDKCYDLKEAMSTEIRHMYFEKCLDNSNENRRFCGSAQALVIPNPDQSMHPIIYDARQDILKDLDETYLDEHSGCYTNYRAKRVRWINKDMVVFENYSYAHYCGTASPTFSFKTFVGKKELKLEDIVEDKDGLLNAVKLALHKKYDKYGLDFDIDKISGFDESIPPHIAGGYLVFNVSSIKDFFHTKDSMSDMVEVPYQDIKRYIKPEIKKYFEK